MRRPVPALLVLATAFLATAGIAAAPSYDPVDPSDQEQLGIYDLNRARHDPPAYGASIGLDLADVPPQPPLAMSRRLVGSARFHVEEMRDHDYFAHTSAVTGDGPNQMAVQHGYDLFGSGLDSDWGADNYIESLAYGYNMLATYPDALAGLIVDEGVASLGHRIHLLAMSSFFQKHREVGAGRATIGSKRYYAYHTGYVESSDTFVTGVVYEDTNGNRRYDLGEGLGGATVAAGGQTTVTGSAGGYSLPLAAGAYTVSCTGGSFPGTASAAVTLAGANIEVDFRSGRASGDVDFTAQGGSEILASDIEASSTRGDAPHTVALDVWCEDPTATASWDLGDGGTSTGNSIVHEYAEPGLYPVTVRTESGEGAGAAIAIVAVDDSLGAGPGTTAPSSTALVATKLKIKVKHNRVGSDKIQFKATLEMPAGFVAGEHPVEMCVGPVKVAFLLGENGKAELPDRSKIKLKWSKPDEGSSLAAGVIAKLKVTLRGDLAERLAAAGLRNADEVKVGEAFPFAFGLTGLAYEGTVDLAITSKEGSKTKAKKID